MYACHGMVAIQSYCEKISGASRWVATRVSNLFKFKKFTEGMQELSSIKVRLTILFHAFSLQGIVAISNLFEGRRYVLLSYFARSTENCTYQ